MKKITELSYMEIFKCNIIALFVMIFMSCNIVHKQNLSKDINRGLALNIDSISYCLPEKEGYFIFERQNRAQFLNLIVNANIPFRTINNNDDLLLIENIKNNISNADRIDLLPYKTNEMIRTTVVSNRLNDGLPGVRWIENDSASIRGCAILYSDSTQSLIWFGLNFVDIEDKRIKCDIYSLLN